MLALGGFHLALGASHFHVDYGLNVIVLLHLHSLYFSVVAFPLTLELLLQV
jgi:hypothetical protein